MRRESSQVIPEQASKPWEKQETGGQRGSGRDAEETVDVPVLTLSHQVDRGRLLVRGVTTRASAGGPRAVPCSGA